MCLLINLISCHENIFILSSLLIPNFKMFLIKLFFFKFPVLVFNWTPEELAQLITNLSACLPRNDNVKYTTLIDKLDWEKVRFGQYTAAQCKEKWMQIVTKVCIFVFLFFLSDRTMEFFFSFFKLLFKK